jgi:DNA-binding transcriptional LysR family regulator
VLPLNALRAFALTVDKGGVRAAARELAFSHSAVSRHLSELERYLGVALFERSGGSRGFTVTFRDCGEKHAIDRAPPLAGREPALAFQQ